jgi:hypothetical protein
MTPQFRNLLLIGGIILISLTLALVAQPPPLTFATGWSAPQQLTFIDLRDTHTVLLAPNNTFQLAWAHQENNVSQIFTGRLDLRGVWVEPPKRISKTGVHSISPQLAQLADGSAVVAYLEKSTPSGLVVARGSGEPLRVVAAVGDMRQLIAVGIDQMLTLAWSENREAQPYVYSTNVTWRDSTPTAGATQRINPEAALATLPYFVLHGERVEAFYFTDDNKYVDLRMASLRASGERATDPAVLSHRTQTGSTGPYPIAAASDDKGNVYLFESLGNVHLTRFAANGARLDAQPIVLERVRSASAVDVKSVGATLWVSWSEARRGKAAQIFVRPFTLDGKPLAAETRLTFTSAGAFQPHWFMDNAGAPHLFWVENISDSDAALFYANTAQPAAVSVWQRLGFAGASPFANMLFTIAAAFMYAIPLLIAFSWRVGLVMIVIVIAYRVRFIQASTYHNLIWFAILIVAELVFSAPTQELLSQPAVALSGLSHWAFSVAATAVTLWTTWQWRNELSDQLRWPALAFIWSYMYYWLNALILLREAYSV